MKNHTRINILNTFFKNNPHPKTQLQFRSNFELLISVILSAQSTDKNVNKVTSILYKVANTPKKILNLGYSKLNKIIKTIGLHKKKTSYILKTCQILKKKFKNVIPRTRYSLEKLPGVGRKTANVILNTIFQKKTIAVDTHVFRVSNRTGFAKGKNVQIVEKKLLRIVPIFYKKNFHNWFLIHGKKICTAKLLKCTICCIQQFCEFKNKNY